MPVRLYGVPIRHVGIVSDARDADGEWLVIHASRRYGQVVESALYDFAWAPPRGPQAPALEGYPGELSPAHVVARARELLGQPYDVRRSNCEHLVAHAHGLPMQSPQWLAWQRRALAVGRDPWGRK